MRHYSAPILFIHCMIQAGQEICRVDLLMTYCVWRVTLDLKRMRRLCSIGLSPGFAIY